MGRKTLVIVAVGVAMCARWLYEPIPSDTTDPWKMRIQLAVAKLMVAIPRGLSKLGISNPRDIQCWMADKIAPTGPGPVELEDVSVINEQVNGVEIRVYRPKSENGGKLRPGMVHIHGGGWVFVKPSHCDKYLIEWARNFNMVIASVNYRSAPQHVFPAAFDDCYSVALYFLMNAEKYGVDSSRVVIAGSSAGGNLAAAVVLKLRDENVPKQPKLQVLISPALQAIDFSLPSYIQNVQGPLLPAELMAWFWSMYIVGDDRYTLTFLNNSHTSRVIKESLAKTHLDHNKLLIDYHYAPYQHPNLDNGDLNVWSKLQDIMLNPYFAPLLANDLSNLPSAYVVTSQYDVLRDDGLLYVTRLREAGVEVTHTHLGNGVHAQVLLMYLKETSAAEDKFKEYLKTNL